jgi:hypothetical protein
MREQGSFPTLKIQTDKNDGNLKFTGVMSKTRTKIEITISQKKRLK